MSWIDAVPAANLAAVKRSSAAASAGVTHIRLPARATRERPLRVACQEIGEVFVLRFVTGRPWDGGQPLNLCFGQLMPFRQLG